MKTLVLIIMLLHGLIHLMGFVKAFDLAEIKELSLPISKAWGVVWLMAFLLFSLTAILYGLNNKYWWIAGIAAVILSQVLIFYFWKDARYAMIPNAILLLLVVIAYFRYDFQRMTDGETQQLLSQATFQNAAVVTEDRIEHLPEPVQKWLKNSGLMGRPEISTVFLRQKALMKMKPEAKNWTEASAHQYFTVQKPAFVWTVNMQMMPLVSVAGRDKFENGKGEMLIKVLSALPVVNSKDNEKTDTGTLQRYLGEIVWFPSAALHPSISWEAIDRHSARATMEYGGTSGSGVFFFDESGRIKRYSAMRYMDSKEGAELKEWNIDVLESRAINGITVPVKLTATWKLDDGDWTWLQLEVTDIAYDGAVK